MPEVVAPVEEIGALVLTLAGGGIGFKRSVGALVDPFATWNVATGDVTIAAPVGTNSGGGTRRIVFLGDVTITGVLTAAVALAAHATALATPRTINGVAFDGSANITTPYATGAVPFAALTGLPATLAGYGIGDAYTKAASDARYLLLAGGTLTGAVTHASSLFGTAAGNTQGLQIVASAASWISVTIDSAGVPKTVIFGSDPTAGGSGFVGTITAHAFAIRANNVAAITVAVSGAVSISSGMTANGGINIAGGGFAQGSIYKDPNYGLSMVVITGANSDFSMWNVAGNTQIIRVPTGSINVVLAGGLTIAAALTLSTYGAGGGLVGAGNVDSGGAGYRLLRVPN
jgi:hypothetical protein